MITCSFDDFEAQVDFIDVYFRAYTHTHAYEKIQAFRNVSSCIESARVSRLFHVTQAHF